MIEEGGIGEKLLCFAVRKLVSDAHLDGHQGLTLDVAPNAGRRPPISFIDKGRKRVEVSCPDCG